MDRNLRRVTELQVRMEAMGLDWAGLATLLQLRCEDGQGVNVETLRRWGDRKHGPCGTLQETLQGVLAAGSIAELGLGHTIDAASHWTRMTPAEKEREVNRRQLLQAGVVAGGLLPVSKLVAAAQLLDQRTAIGAGDLATAQEVATHLASRYLATPDADVVRAARAHAHTLFDLLARAKMSPDTRAGLAAVASDAAALAGYGQLNAGRFAEAAGWFAEALALARQAGDRRLEAFALAAFAAIPGMAPEPDHAAAVAALEPAAALQGFLRPAERASVFGSLGCERAALGDDLASGRFLEHARAAAALIPHDEPGWGWWSTHGQLGGWEGDNPEVYTAGRFMWLGRPADAVQVFEAAAGTARPARRADLKVHLANSWVALGDPERTCASAMAALDEAKPHELGRIPAKVRNARAAFPRDWARLGPVVDLDERLALAR